MSVMIDLDSSRLHLNKSTYFLPPPSGILSARTQDLGPECLHHNIGTHTDYVFQRPLAVDGDVELCQHINQNIGSQPTLTLPVSMGTTRDELSVVSSPPTLPEGCSLATTRELWGSGSELAKSGVHRFGRSSLLSPLNQ